MVVVCPIGSGVSVCLCACVYACETESAQVSVRMYACILCFVTFTRNASTLGIYSMPSKYTAAAAANKNNIDFCYRL